MTKKKYIAKNTSKGIAILRVEKVTYTIKPESEITFLAFENEKMIYPKGIVEVEEFVQVKPEQTEKNKIEKVAKPSEKEENEVKIEEKPKRSRKKSVKIETEEG